MTTKLLSEVGIKNVDLVGGKNASLGEMLQNLTGLGIKVPDGFVVTTLGYQRYLNDNDLEPKIKDITSKIDAEDLIDLRRKGLEIRSLIQNAEFSPEMEAEILEQYHVLSNQYKDAYGKTQDSTDVAVRSSSTAEDLQDASFAGQQETYLNVRGKYQLLESIKNCFASLYTDRAISYRKSIEYDGKLSISVCIQKMVRSDLGSAGVAFSIDPESGFRDLIIINGAWGLGELVVQGAVKPDEFIVFKKTLHQGYDAIIDKKMGNKVDMIVYGTNPDQKVKKIPTMKDKVNKFCLSDNNILKLAKWVAIIEKYYTKLYGRWTPVDIEWAVDGLNEELFLVQARPETVHANKSDTTVSQFKINKTKDTTVLIKGIAVGNKISSGKVRIIHSLDNREVGLESIDFDEGDILVTDITDPDWEPIMVKSSAIITNKGGRTSHAAIISREMGLNAVVGTNNCTELLKDGETVTVSCAEGDDGIIYSGIVEYEETKIDLGEIPNLKTNLMFNIASPNEVFKYASYPVRGVGLVREEFIINNFIQVHPCALLNIDDRLEKDSELKNQINELTIGYNSYTEYYINKLAYGLARIASTFYPHEVIVRFSDFKSNEYCNLLGGKYYEPHEENPMIGWRGASRYYDPRFKDAFGLECLAIKKLREEMGLMNVVVMIPFCRTPEECIKVQEVMEEYGLKRGENGLKVYIMCEIPSNVILADEFCKHVDGFSIGSNDLTQLTLGLDRDSELVSHIYNERNPAVKSMISQAIKTCKKNGVKIGICGQGPSDYPDFAAFLVEEGIDSISITPDSILKTVEVVSKIENQN
jgi:pyruvate,water dikinase